MSLRLPAGDVSSTDQYSQDPFLLVILQSRALHFHSRERLDKYHFNTSLCIRLDLIYSFKADNHLPVDLVKTLRGQGTPWTW
ncbi:MAG: hypothetical protein WC756_15415 [Taibaiella sp.]